MGDKLKATTCHQNNSNGIDSKSLCRIPLKTKWTQFSLLFIPYNKPPQKAQCFQFTFNVSQLQIQQSDP